MSKPFARRHMCPQTGPRPPARLDGDGHIGPQKQQKAQEPFDREPGEAAADERRNLWLVHSQNLSSLHLGQTAPAENAGDLVRQFRLSEHLVCIRELQIGKHIATAFDVVAFSHHLPPEYASCSIIFKRDRICPSPWGNNCPIAPPCGMIDAANPVSTIGVTGSWQRRTHSSFLKTDGTTRQRPNSTGQSSSATAPTCSAPTCASPTSAAATPAPSSTRSTRSTARPSASSGSKAPAATSAASSAPASPRSTSTSCSTLEKIYRGVEHEDEMVAMYPLCAFGNNPVAASIDTPLHGFLPFAARRPPASRLGHRPRRLRQRQAEDGGVQQGVRPQARLAALAAPRLRARHDARSAASRTTPAATASSSAATASSPGATPSAKATSTPSPSSTRSASSSSATPQRRPRRRSAAPSTRRATTVPPSRRTSSLTCAAPSAASSAGSAASPTRPTCWSSSTLRRRRSSPTSAPAALTTSSAPRSAPCSSSGTRKGDTANFCRADRLDARDLPRGVRRVLQRLALPDSPNMRDASPTVVLIPGVGMFSFGKNKTEARITGEFYTNAIHVMEGAGSLGAGGALHRRAAGWAGGRACGSSPSTTTTSRCRRSEAFRIEYWALEEAKIRRQPPEKELSRRIAAGRRRRQRHRPRGRPAGRRARRAHHRRRPRYQGRAVGRRRGQGHRRQGSRRLASASTSATAPPSRPRSTPRSKQFGGIDILINTAAIFPSTPDGIINDKLWGITLEVNVTANYMLADEAAADLRGAGYRRQHRADQLRQRRRRQEGHRGLRRVARPRSAISSASSPSPTRRRSASTASSPPRSSKAPPCSRATASSPA